MGAKIRSRDGPKFCRKCGQQAHVIDSRPVKDAVLRRHLCSCAERWSTVEFRVENSGSRFNHNRLRSYHKQRDALLVTKVVKIIRDNVNELILRLGDLKP